MFPWFGAPVASPSSRMIPTTPLPAVSYNEVKELGARESTIRTQEETYTGIFWAYDGSFKIGTPIRLYNQVLNKVVTQVKKRTNRGYHQGALPGQTLATGSSLVKLYAMVNVAMADTVILSWKEKYEKDFWRPVAGIRASSRTGLLLALPRVGRCPSPSSMFSSLAPLPSTLPPSLQRRQCPRRPLPPPLTSRVPRRLVLGDVSVIHPAVVSYAQAATQLPGSAAASRDAAKERAYRLVSSGLPSVPLSVESFGRLCAPALTLLRSLADHAVQAGGQDH
jgi:hypothetical protein